MGSCTTIDGVILFVSRELMFPLQPTMTQSEELVKSEYREQLLALEQKSTESFDKTVLTLSAGALGLSITFLNNIVELSNAVQTIWLNIAWGFWAASLIFTLSSFWLSAQAMRKAVTQVHENRLSYEHQGGSWDKATAVLTPLGGLAFIFGAVAMMVFIYFNMKGT